MRILIADDHALFRYGVSLAVSELYEDVAVLEASTIDEALKIARSGDKLDLILLDLMMPGSNGFEGLKRVIEAVPGVPVVIVSASNQHANIRSAIQYGARGYILKSSSGEILKHVIPLVLSGELYIPASAVSPSPGGEAGLAEWERTPEAPPSFKGLTPRESEVLRLLTLGYSNKEIARTLGLLEGTVKVHLKSIMKKLGVNNRTQAAMMAARMAGASGETSL